MEPVEASHGCLRFDGPRSACFVLLCLGVFALQGCFEIAEERSRLKAKVQEIEDNQSELEDLKGSGQGVIWVGGSNHHVSNSTHSYTFDALLCIASLRRTGSTLPVELWHDDDPMLLGTKLPENVILRSFNEVTGNTKVKGYQLPALAMFLDDL